MSKSKFIKDLKNKCEKHGINLLLKNDLHVEMNGDKFGGWFEPDTNELVCAYKQNNKRQLAILVHESCHLDQHIIGTPIWERMIKNESSEKLWRWMGGEDFGKREIGKFIKDVQMVEAECERMSVKKIRKYDLDIDLVRYREKANAYILFYTVLKDTRKWYGNKPPYKLYSIWKNMPSTRIVSNFNMSKELKELFKEKIYGVDNHKK